MFANSKHTDYQIYYNRTCKASVKTYLNRGSKQEVGIQLSSTLDVLSLSSSWYVVSTTSSIGEEYHLVNTHTQKKHGKINKLK